MALNQSCPRNRKLPSKLANDNILDADGMEFLTQFQMGESTSLDDFPALPLAHDVVPQNVPKVTEEKLDTTETKFSPVIVGQISAPPPKVIDWSAFEEKQRKIARNPEWRTTKKAYDTHRRKFARYAPPPPLTPQTRKHHTFVVFHLILVTSKTSTASIS
jgi:hypothetical protein